MTGIAGDLLKRHLDVHWAWRDHSKQDVSAVQSYFQIFQCQDNVQSMRAEIIFVLH